MPEILRVRGSMPGAGDQIENGRYRFARVYNGENWNPELKAPLTQPGVNVADRLPAGGQRPRGPRRRPPL